MAKSEADEEADLPYANLRMLAVDDEPTFIETYRRHFAKRGMEVDVAPDLAEFMRLLKERHHHVVICDYYLDADKVDGNHLMQLVEEHDRDAAVIVVTGRPSLDAAVASLLKKAANFLQKPIKIDDLAAAVDKALRDKGLLRMSDSELKRKIGERIREGRKSRGLTLAQLSERTGLSVGFLSQIELGKNSASVETLYRIGRALAVDPGDFFQE